MRWSKVLCVGATLAVAALAVTGCSDGAKRASSPAPRSTAATSTVVEPTATSTTVAAPTTATLQNVTVARSDLPTGWVPSGPAIPDNVFSLAGSQLANCEGVAQVSGDIVASAPSGPYISGTSLIASTAVSLPTAGDLDAVVTTLRNPRLGPCFDDLATSESYDGATLADAVTTVDIGAGLGPANVAGSVHTSFTATYLGDREAAAGDVVVITGRQLLVSVLFFGLSGGVPTAVEQSVVANVAARVARG